MKFLSFAVFTAIIGCAQSTVVFDPVQNKAPGLPVFATEGTVTLSVNLTAQGANHQNQAFSALLFQSGVLKASLTQNGSFTTNGSGQGTAVMRSVTASNCMDTTSAILPNGNYDLYFAINYAGQAIGTVFSPSCGAPGFLASLPNNLYDLRSNVTINGNTTFTINDVKVAVGKTHSFQFTGVTPGSRRFLCNLFDPNASSYTSHPLAVYQTSAVALTDAGGNGTITTSFSLVISLPLGTYKHFCFVDVNNNANIGDSGDKMAVGYTTVTGFNTTYLANSDFSIMP